MTKVPNQYLKVYDRNINRASFIQLVGSNNLPINNFTRPNIDVNTNRFSSAQGYTYDLNGNVIVDAEGRTLIYDAENKQKEVKNSLNQVVCTYYYDGDGKEFPTFWIIWEENLLALIITAIVITKSTKNNKKYKEYYETSI